MKRQFSILAVCSAATMFLLSSCQKDLADLKKNEIKNTPLPGQTTYCRVESIWQKATTGPGAQPDRFYLVKYDEFENPIYITNSKISTAYPFHVFKYDSWHRLREYRGEYGNGAFEFWHRYGYDNQGRIGVDTVYIFGLLGENPTLWNERRITTIEYDDQNRVSHTHRVSSLSQVGVSDQYFNYDANGNLIYPAWANVVYDDKVNMNRTNDIWQFLSKDYSMNNPFVAEEYNAQGLPTKTDFTPGAVGNWLQREFNIYNAEISYSCHPAYW